jgi:hypothetical protein
MPQQDRTEEDDHKEAENAVRVEGDVEGRDNFDKSEQGSHSERDFSFYDSWSDILSDVTAMQSKLIITLPARPPIENESNERPWS